MAADHVGATTTVTPPPSTTFVWKIQGVTPALFTDAVKGIGGKLTSPHFPAAGKEWRPTLYPGGHTAEAGAAGKVVVALFLRTPNAASFSPAVTFHFGGSKHEKESQLWSPLPPSCLASDFSSLLTSADGADVTLLCGAERIPAHATILCARSAVFRAQLRGPLACLPDAVPVPEEIDAPTLKRTLQFIYSEECEPESAEEAQHLLNAADHYGLIRLRAICERTLIASLSVENVAFTLTLAEQHSAGVLRDAALRFVAKNAVEVMRTEGWAHLRASSPALMEAAMMTTCVTGEPPQADDGGLGGEAADAEGSGRRVRRRTQ